MATETEIFKYIAKIEGEAEVKRLAAEAKRLEDMLKQSIEMFGATSGASKHFAAELANTTTQLNKAQMNVGKLGNSINQLGYAVDDVQFGFKGISNNIQPILSGIPGLEKWAGAISIAAIAAYQLYEHWDKVSELLGLGLPKPALTGLELLSDNLKKATKEMEELAKKTRLEWYELDKLAKLKVDIAQIQKDIESQHDVDQAGKQLSDAEKEAGSGFGKAIAESGGKNAHDELVGRLGDDKNAKGMVFNDATRKMSTPEEAARDLMAGALNGDRRLRDIIKGKLANDSKFKQNIGLHSPEAAAASKEDEAARKLEQEQLDETYAASQRALAEKKRNTDAANAAWDADDKEAAETDRRDKEAKEKADKEAKRRSDQALDTAKRTPGIEQAIKSQLKGMIGSGMSGLDAQSALTQQLSGALGVGPAMRLAAEGRTAAEDELMSNALAGGKHRNSQVIGAEGLASSIQSAVGGDDTLKKQLEQQTLAAQYLAQIADNAGRQRTAAFDTNGNLTIN